LNPGNWHPKLINPGLFQTLGLFGALGKDDPGWDCRLHSLTQGPTCHIHHLPQIYSPHIDSRLSKSTRCSTSPLRTASSRHGGPGLGREQPSNATVVIDDADVKDDLMLAFRMLRSSGTTVVRDLAVVVLGGSGRCHVTRGQAGRACSSSGPLLELWLVPKQFGHACGDWRTRQMPLATQRC
jgi:hypothetical protein